MRERYSSSARQYNVDTSFSYFYLLLASLIFWIVGYVSSTGYPVYEGVTSTPLWNAVCRLMPDKTVTYLIGAGLTIGGAFLIHRANYVLVIIREKTFLPFVIYILLISTNPDYFPLRSTSVGIFCLIIAIYQLFLSYHDSNSVGKAFNLALFIGAGSLLWIHIVWFLPLFWYGMYRFQSLSLRTFLSSMIGFGTVYWFLLGWCLFKWDFTSLIVPFQTLSKIGYFQIPGMELIDWIILGYIVLLTLIACLYIMTHEYDETIRSRQFLYFLMVFVFLSFALFFLYEQSSTEFLCIACMPISILLTHFFTVNKGRKRVWVFHIASVVYIVLAFYRLWSSSSNMVI